MRFKFLILLFVLGICLAACGPVSEPTFTPTLKPTSTDPPPSPTRAPTQTPAPSHTPTPSPSYTPAPLELEVYGVSWLDSGDLLITLQGTEPFSDDYILDLRGYLYNCRIAQDSDMLLFCAGRIAPQGASVPISLIREVDGREVFRININVPYQSSPGSSGGGESEGTPDLTPDPVSSPVPTT